ncbi:MAG: hypothetical protein ACI4QA_04430 [Candidatus Spyradosoma sp.]
MTKTLFRISLSALVCAAAVFTGSALGAFFAGTPAEARERVSVDVFAAPDVFAQARERLEKILETEPFSQLEMTMASAEIFRLAEAEIDWLECAVVNAPAFDETEYARERDAWRARFDAALNAPSDFDGGTMEHADRALRAAELLRERASALRARLEKTR